MANNRVTLDVDYRIPAATAIAYQRGGRVNGAQEAVNTVVVHDHGFAASDKFLYAFGKDNILTSRVFTVSSTASTSVTFSGDTFSFPDGAYLVNIGADTVTANDDGSWPLPNWDASDITMYTDAAGDDTVSSVSIPNDGEIEFWASSVPVWVVLLDNGNRPIKFFVDIGMPAAAASSSVTRASTAPSSPNPGDIWIDSSSVPDITYIYILITGSTFDWVEIISGEV